MYYVYILYYAASDLYYVGYSDNPQRRLIEHNSKRLNTFSSKHRPWVLKSVFQSGISEAETMRIEKFIKKQKSRKLLEQLCNPSFIPIGILAWLESRTSGINQRVIPAQSGTAGAALKAGESRPFYFFSKITLTAITSSVDKKSLLTNFSAPALIAFSV